MNFYEELIKHLKKFENSQKTSNSNTKLKSNEAEDFFLNVFKKLFGDKIKVLTNGTHEHPDFYALNKNKYNSIIETDKYKKLNKKRKSARIESYKGIIDKLFDKKDILRIEIKSYILPPKNELKTMLFNDTFPNPIEENNTIYVFFAKNETDFKVYISTSFYMAEKSVFNIKEKFIESEKNIKELRLKSNSMWEETSVSTYLRPGYNIKSDYFEIYSDEMNIEINNLLKNVIY